MIPREPLLMDNLRDNYIFTSYGAVDYSYFSGFCISHRHFHYVWFTDEVFMKDIHLRGRKKTDLVQHIVKMSL